MPQQYYATAVQQHFATSSAINRQRGKSCATNAIIVMHRAFAQNLEKLKARLIRMGSIVEEQIEFAFRALLEGRNDLAQLVLERDDKVDELDMKIDRQCQRIFALHQPVAKDLRLLLVSLKLNNELERIGDLAFNIARHALAIPDVARYAKEFGLERMTSGVLTMMKYSMDAFINLDTTLAEKIIQTDSQIDQLENEITQAIIQKMKADPDFIEPGIHFVIILRNLERMADQATNIAENVIFLVNAQIAKSVAERSGTPM